LPLHIQALAHKKLRAINSALRVEDLRVPQGNRLEALQGLRIGQWSIRINAQWRIH
jgi:proteic killer suppression protein